MLAGVPSVEHAEKSGVITMLDYNTIRDLDFMSDQIIRTPSWRMLKACSRQRRATSPELAETNAINMHAEVGRKTERKNKRYEAFKVHGERYEKHRIRSEKAAEKTAKSEGWTKERTRKKTSTKAERLKKKELWAEEVGAKAKTKRDLLNKKMKKDKAKEKKAKRAAGRFGHDEASAKQKLASAKKDGKKTSLSKMRKEAQESEDAKVLNLKKRQAEVKSKAEKVKIQKNRGKEAVAEKRMADLKKVVQGKKMALQAEENNASMKESQMKAERKTEKYQKSKKAKAGVITEEFRQAQQAAKEGVHKKRRGIQAQNRAEKKALMARQVKKDAERFRKWQEKKESQASFENKLEAQQMETEQAMDAKMLLTLKKGNTYLMIKNKEIIRKLKISGSMKSVRSYVAKNKAKLDHLKSQHKIEVGAEELAESRGSLKPEERISSQKLVRGWAEELKQLHVPKRERDMRVANVFGVKAAAQMGTTRGLKVSSEGDSDVLSRLEDATPTTTEGLGEPGEASDSAQDVLTRLQSKLLKGVAPESHEFASLNGEDND